MFKTLDKDCSNEISLDELKNGANGDLKSKLTNLFGKDFLRVRYFEVSDTDHNNGINLEEFLMWAENTKRRRQLLMSTFRMMDKDASNEVSLRELVQSMRTNPEIKANLSEIIGTELTMAEFKRADKSGDNSLDFYEFVQWAEDIYLQRALE